MSGTATGECGTPIPYPREGTGLCQRVAGHTGMHRRGAEAVESDRTDAARDHQRRIAGLDWPAMDLAPAVSVEPQTYECMNCGVERTRDGWISCEDKLGRSCIPRPECPTFTPADGAAWSWCDDCGVRADLHAGDDERTEGYRRAVRRVIERTYA